MIDKRVIAVIVIFILGGLFIYSFANPMDGADENPTTNGGVVTPDDKDSDKEEKPTEIDTKALEDIKAYLAGLNRDDYTEESWDFIQNLIHEAEGTTTQEELDEILSQIDFGTLNKKEDSNPVEIGNSTGGSSNNNSNRPSGGGSSNNTNKPNGGNSGSVAPVNKTVLNNIKNIVASLNRNDYTEDSFQKVIEASNLPENTQAEVDAKVVAIQNAINNLKPKKPVAPTEIDKTALNNIKAQLAKLKESNYTVASWKAIQDQIAVAEAQVTQEKFDAEVAKINLNTLQLRTTATKIGVSLDKMGDSANIQTVKVNDTYYRYTGVMNTNTLTTENGTTIRDFIVMRITSPDALSQTERNNIKMVYQGMNIDASEFKIDNNNHSYIEIYQPFSRSNDGSGSTDNLTTVGFTINWGYGETTQYTITIDVAVN